MKIIYIIGGICWAFNILKTAKQVSQARAEYEKSLAEFDSTKNSVYYNVKKAYLDFVWD